MDLELIKRISVGASYKSADLLHKYLGNISQISKKGAIDIVTEADIESEKVLTSESLFLDPCICAAKCR